MSNKVSINQNTCQSSRQSAVSDNNGLSITGRRAVQTSGWSPWRRGALYTARPVNAHKSISHNISSWAHRGITKLYTSSPRRETKLYTKDRRVYACKTVSRNWIVPTLAHTYTGTRIFEDRGFKSDRVDAASRHDVLASSALPGNITPAEHRRRTLHTDDAEGHAHRACAEPCVQPRCVVWFCCRKSPEPGSR